MPDLEYTTTTQDRSDVLYEHGTTHRNLALRVKIRVNSYDFQSTAVAEVWSQKDLRWNQIATVPYDLWWVSPYADHEQVMQGIEDAENELLARAYATLD